MEQAKPHLPDVIYCHSAYEAAAGVDAVVIATEWEQFRALDLARLRSAMSAAGDRRPAEYLSRRRNEAGKLPLCQRRAGRAEVIAGRAAQPPPFAADAVVEPPCRGVKLWRCGRPAAQRDFVFVSGPPTLHRRAAEHGTGLAARMRRRPPPCLSLQAANQKSEHGKTADTITPRQSADRPAGQSPQGVYADIRLAPF